MPVGGWDAAQSSWIPLRALGRGRARWWPCSSREAAASVWGGRDAARSSRRAGRALRTLWSENVLLLAWGVVWGGITTPQAVACMGLLHRWVVWGCAEGRGSGLGLRAHRRVAGAAARPGSAWRGKTMAEGRQGVVGDFGKQWHGAEQPAARLRPRGASGHADLVMWGGGAEGGAWIAACRPRWTGGWWHVRRTYRTPGARSG